MKPIVIPNPEVVIKLSKEQAIDLGIDFTKELNPGIMETVGLWDIPKSFKALCSSAKFTTSGFTSCTEMTLYGLRTMSQVKQSGYELEGRVSIGGKKYSSFTSSKLFEVDGKLIDVAIIHARV